MTETAHQSAHHFAQQPDSANRPPPSAVTDHPPRPDPPGAPTWRERLSTIARELVAARARTAATAGGALALVAVAVVASALWFRAPVPPAELSIPMAEPSAAGGADDGGAGPTAGPLEVVAHAAGAVVAPGVYRLPAGSRVSDLIDAAGGPTSNADLDRLNLAMRVEDGARVYVPRVGEPSADVVETAAPPAPVDLNTATVEQLDALPGVGPATAAAIVEHRRTKGRFRRVDDLLDVAGIGDAKLARLRPLVKV